MAVVASSGDETADAENKASRREPEYLRQKLRKQTGSIGGFGKLSLKTKFSNFKKENLREPLMTPILEQKNSIPSYKEYNDITLQTSASVHTTLATQHPQDLSSLSIEKTLTDLIVRPALPELHIKSEVLPSV